MTENNYYTQAEYPPLVFSDCTYDSHLGYCTLDAISAGGFMKEHCVKNVSTVDGKSEGTTYQECFDGVTTTTISVCSTLQYMCSECAYVSYGGHSLSGNVYYTEANYPPLTYSGCIYSASRGYCVIDATSAGGLTEEHCVSSVTTFSGKGSGANFTECFTLQHLPCYSVSNDVSPPPISVLLSPPTPVVSTPHAPPPHAPLSQLPSNVTHTSSPPPVPPSPQPMHTSPLIPLSLNLVAFCAICALLVVWLRRHSSLS